MIGLEYLRKKANMSIAQLGEKIGVSRQVITRWENEEQSLPTKRIKELATFFKVDEKYICERVVSHFDRIMIEMEQYLNSYALWDKHWDIECKKADKTCEKKDLVNYMQSYGEETKSVWEKFNKYISGQYSITEIDRLFAHIMDFKKTFMKLKNIFSENNSQVRLNEVEYLNSWLMGMVDELQQAIDAISDISELTENVYNNLQHIVNEGNITDVGKEN